MGVATSEGYATAAAVYQALKPLDEKKEEDMNVPTFIRRQAD